MPFVLREQGKDCMHVGGSYIHRYIEGQVLRSRDILLNSVS